MILVKKGSRDPNKVPIAFLSFVFYSMILKGAMDYGQNVIH
ncbi:hypothetical protein HMPREF0542_11607 [Ligilactobacillus ruminis ATCC 25644]|uniref:Uncharacterized protein n=1 Tax=Ligilactobacillus ruminis ATCC 25644 TaxID=525362 RepID=E7FRT0_9LACO|nr:hypothetical protein HMPREF0542_11607 [Ligilactobacillus ruminis ATCC 25644]EGX98324.1 hypothetical protein ANHS_1044 [Ligilactobacillus ruminis ATCC 25644]